jgi:hypothetical protein
MNIKVVRIVDRGVPNKERLHLSVRAATNLNFYAVFHTDYIDSSTIESTPKHAYWFGDHHVKVGDYVILYTNAGKDVVQVRKDGGTNHFFHWGLEQVIFADNGECAVLLELANWETSPPG